MLTECFGGFTPAGDEPGADGWRLDDPHGKGPGSPSVGVRKPRCLPVHRERLVDLVVRMGEDLDQADVFILAYDSDSLLIEVAERAH